MLCGHADFERSVGWVWHLEKMSGQEIPKGGLSLEIDDGWARGMLKKFTGRAHRTQSPSQSGPLGTLQHRSGWRTRQKYRLSRTEWNPGVIDTGVSCRAKNRPC